MLAHHRYCCFGGEGRARDVTRVHVQARSHALEGAAAAIVSAPTDGQPFSAFLCRHRLRCCLASTAQGLLLIRSRMALRLWSQMNQISCLPSHGGQRRASHRF